jgi:phage replication-related protein YjqB (UPF0714/DUF867 family)
MAALLRSEDPRSYAFEIKEPHSSVAVLAPHGGEIEWGTNQIAAAIAGEDYRLFCFNGNRIGGETFRYLHVKSHLYDDEQCHRLIKPCSIVVAIHGWNEEKLKLPPNIYLGGRDEKLRETIGSELTRLGFGIAAFSDPTNNYTAQRTKNICNCGKTGRGVQLELPRLLRRELVPRTGLRPSRFDAFVEAIRRVIRTFDR